MKCQNCGKNEVSFHYTSNVNGAVTETHLCSECAMQAGYDVESMFDLGNMFDDLLPLSSMFGNRGGISGFMPLAVPMVSTDRLVPFRVRPRPALDRQRIAKGCECCTETKKEHVEVDETMSKLRELNVELRAAIESENFERAAEIRDQIKELKA